MDFEVIDTLTADQIEVGDVIRFPYDFGDSDLTPDIHDVEAYVYEKTDEGRRIVIKAENDWDQQLSNFYLAPDALVLLLGVE